MLHPIIASARLAYITVRRLLRKVFFELPAGIETDKIVRLHEVGLAASNRGDYYPTPWLALKRVLSDHEVTDRDVFIDFGCGKGRVLFQAAMYRFRRVIGVEISADLAKVARSNIERSSAKLRCRDVEVVNKDVLDYEVPDDVTIVYFFNPFNGEIFSAVLDKLLASLRRRPRELTIIYKHPAEEQTLLKAGARLVKATRGMRPTQEWAWKNTIRTYKLGVPADAQGRSGSSDKCLTAGESSLDDSKSIGPI